MNSIGMSMSSVPGTPAAAGAQPGPGRPVTVHELAPGALAAVPIGELLRRRAAEQPDGTALVEVASESRPERL